jgi:hypothetical protein
VEEEGHDKVVHAEKAASERVGPVRHDIWDVHCKKGRWWVVTNPMNLYDQRDFKSRDVVLTFHIGLTLRMSLLEEREVPVRPEVAVLLPGTWRRWSQAFETYDSGDEAENFQSVGVRLRECLVSFIGETCEPGLVPAGNPTPKKADFKGWVELLANDLAPGDPSARLRSCLKKTADECWDYVNWLTHAKSAIRLDAEIGLKLVEHLLGIFTAARLRKSKSDVRCQSCGSYNIVAGSCQSCEWTDPNYREPRPRRWTRKERARRLATPCTPSSDISTFMAPRDRLR